MGRVPIWVGIDHLCEQRRHPCANGRREQVQCGGARTHRHRGLRIKELHCPDARKYLADAYESILWYLRHTEVYSGVQGQLAAAPAKGQTRLLHRIQRCLDTRCHSVALCILVATHPFNCAQHGEEALTRTSTRFENMQPVVLSNSCSNLHPLQKQQIYAVTIYHRKSCKEEASADLLQCAPFDDGTETREEQLVA